MPQYPGLGLPLRAFAQQTQLDEKGVLYPIGIDDNCSGSESEMLLVREVAMMIFMDRITDKPNWHIKVFDDAISEKWVEEGLAMPSEPLYNSIVKGKISALSNREFRHPKRLKTILDQGCLEYCIKELRAKAEAFNETGLIPTLDASATIVKSDTLINESLQQELCAAFAKLKDDQAASPDFHPRTDGKVQNLVHPSLYPLVYGKSRVFQEEVVGVEDAIDKWAGKGQVIPEQHAITNSSQRQREYFAENDPGKSFWSENYQWLPSIVKFQDDGSLRFTSYINNLHPTKHCDVYRTIEKLIEKALPAWDLCLKQYSRNVDATTITPGRCEPRFPLPANPDDENPDNWDPPFNKKKRPFSGAGATQRGQKQDVEDSDNYEDAEESDDHEGCDSEGNRYYGTKKEVEWEKTRIPVQPEAPDFEAWEYKVLPGKSLREQYKDLQVIVKMASIELTPGNPDFPAGGWHVEGQMNERIIATALYYLDCENVTSSHLDFRMQTSCYQDDLQERVGQDSYKWLEMVYGTRLLTGTPCLQNYGNVETKKGRLLAFPNTFQHRVSPFELRDKTKPGHRRFVALWLVDPFNRIISTANVPPQQQSWWLERSFSRLGVSDEGRVPQSIAQLIVEKTGANAGGTLLEAAEGTQDLPAEVMTIVRAEFGDSLLMSHDEALDHRLKLMDERSVTERKALEGWFGLNYSFCEH